MEEQEIINFNIEKLNEEIETNRNSLKTDRLDMSFGEIMSMYERDEIIIAPEFQRLFRWKVTQQTRFLESIILGIPIPPIFVAEDQNGKWELVDGLQRLSTIISFFGLLKNDINNKNNWTMEAGTLIKSFEGMKKTDFPLNLQLNIKRAYCRVEIVKWDSKYDMRYELFDRLNTGGSPLTEQEIRNCVFRGYSDEFNKFIKRVADNQDFQEVTSPTERQISELYLEELVLRTVSLIDSEEIKENISRHMTRYMETILNEKIEEKSRVQIKNHNEAINDRVKRLEAVINNVIYILKPLGKDIFRLKFGGLSTSLYDVITVGIAENIELYKKLDKEQLKDKIEKLKICDKFKDASGSSSHSKTRVQKRVDLAREIFSSVENDVC